ncbi:MAG: type II secretion system protein GspG [Puniceicoccales bacterium]|jgi:type II secretory pathway pseudopilin PulG|nr:type II secretion system protein GspG [Puniceicoccales bacterium]
MFHSLRSKYNHGFTFLEIIAIIAIIICSVLFKVIHNYRSDDIKSNVAQEELALLNCAIEMFKSDNAFYPTCTSPMVSSNAKELYGKLSTKINSLAGHHRWQVTEGMLIDPWGNPYVYKCDSKDSPTYVLFSVGPNGHIDETEIIDDIYSR